MPIALISFITTMCIKQYRIFIVCELLLNFCLLNSIRRHEIGCRTTLCIARPMPWPVRLSATFVYCIETHKHVLKLFSPSGIVRSF